MKYFVISVAIFSSVALSVIGSWIKEGVVSLAITRKVNAYYRTTQDLEGYVQIVTSGYDQDIINSVFEKGFLKSA